MKANLYQARSNSFVEPLQDAARPIAQHARPLRGTELPAAWSGSSYVVAAEVQGQLSAAVLQQAGLRLQRRYPGLRARCVLPTVRQSIPVIEFCAPDRQRFHFQEIRADRGGARDPDHIDTLERSDVPLWHQTVERNVSAPFDARRGFMFRVFWMPQREHGGYVVLCASEAIADEPSLLHLLEVLLHECGRIAQVPAFQRIDSDWLDSENVPPALLDVLPLGIGEFIAARFRQVMRVLVRFPAPRVPQFGDCPEAASPRYVTRCRFVSGSLSDCRQVLALLHTQDMELRYVLAAAAQFAWARESSEVTGTPPWSRPEPSLALDVDMRHMLRGQLGLDPLGMFQGTVIVSAPMFERLALWDLARTLQQHGRRQLNRGAASRVHTYCDRSFRFCAEVNPLEPTWMLRKQHPTLHVGCTSTRALAHQYGPLSLVRTCIARSRLVGAAPYAIWMHVLGERFQYSLSSAESEFARERGSAFLARVVELVENIHLSDVRTLSIRMYATAGLSSIVGV